MPRPLHLLRTLRISPMLFGLLLIAAAGLLFEACSAASQNRVQCELDAVVKVLPQDPDELTLGDLKDVSQRLRQCHAREPGPPTPDAGAVP